jgi:hypothetical protein
MKNLFYILLAVVFVGATAFAAVSSFPYSTTFQTDNIGAGNWTVNNTHGQNFVNVSTAGSGNGDDFCVAVTQNTNSNGDYSALRLNLNTTGLTFTGAEAFTFVWKISAPSNKIVLQVWENSSGSFVQVGSNITLNQTAYTLATFTPPSGMGNKSSVDLEIRVAQIANGNPNATVSIDDPTLTGGALPIQLSSFTGIALENTVRLDWATESETNNYGWYIERMAENEANYTELGFVAGAGTTLEPQVYSYSDENVASGKYYYRLRQVDLTGDVSYSQPIQVVVNGVLAVGDKGGPVVFKLNQNYPNPFNPSTEIKYSVAKAGLVTLKVYNLIGQEVASLVNQEQTAGEHAVKFDASSLSSGIYLYRLSSGSETAVKSMMLVK